MKKYLKKYPQDASWRTPAKTRVPDEKKIPLPAYIRDLIYSFTTRELYRAIFLMVASQALIFGITLHAQNITESITYPTDTSKIYVHMLSGEHLTTTVALAVSSLLLVVYALSILKPSLHDSTRQKLTGKRIVGIAGLIALVLLVLTLLNTPAVTEWFNKTWGIQLHSEPQSNQSAINALVQAVPLLMIIHVVIVAPIVEEVVFRELLPKAWGAHYIMYVLATVLFGAIHSPSGIYGWISYLLTAFLFLHVRLRLNNVHASILAHMMWNSLSVLPIIIAIVVSLITGS